MGFFETKYVLTGTKQTSYLFETNLKPNLLKQNIIGAVLRNDYDVGFNSPKRQTHPITTGILLAANSNLKTSIDRYYRYAKDKHPDGVVEIESVTGDLGDELPEDAYVRQLNNLTDIITAQEGTDIQIVDYSYRTLTNKFALQLEIQRLQNTTNQVVSHNRLTDDYFDPKAMRFHHVSGDLVENWEYGWLQDYDEYGDPDGEEFFIPQFEEPGDNYIIQDSAFGYTRDGFEQTDGYNRNDPLGDKDAVAIARWRNNRRVGSFAFYVDRTYYEGRTEDLYHQVVYKKVDTEEHFAWIYHQDENTYPELHLAGNLDLTDAIIPRLYLADNKALVYEGELGEDYKTHTEKLGKTFGLVLGDLHQALLPGGKQDPNYETLEDAFVEWSADLNTTSQDELAYIYQYFRRVYLNPQDVTGKGSKSGSRRTSVFTSWKKIQMHIRTGDVDTFGGSPIWETTHTVSDKDPNFTGRLIRDANNPTKFLNRISKQYSLGPRDGREGYIEYPESKYTLRKQITSTEFVELTIERFRRADTFYERAYRDNRLLSYVVQHDISTIDEGGLLVPVTTNTLNDFNPIQQSGILFDSCKFTVRATQIITVKWYEQEGFWNLVRAVIAIFSLGTSEAWAEGFLAVIQEFIVDRVIAEIVIKLLVLVVELVGVEVGGIIAAIAAVYALTEFDGEFLNLLDSEEMLLAATAMIEATNQVIIDEIEAIQTQAELYAETYDEYQDEIEKYFEEIGMAQLNGREIYEQTRATHIPSSTETPDEFFNRCIHITNPGVLSLDGCDVYAEVNTYLPKPVTFKSEENNGLV